MGGVLSYCETRRAKPGEDTEAPAKATRRDSNAAAAGGPKSSSNSTGTNANSNSFLGNTWGATAPGVGTSGGTQGNRSTTADIPSTGGETPTSSSSGFFSTIRKSFQSLFPSTRKGEGGGGEEKKDRGGDAKATSDMVFYKKSTTGASTATPAPESLPWSPQTVGQKRGFDPSVIRPKPFVVETDFEMFPIAEASPGNTPNTGRSNNYNIDLPSPSDQSKQSLSSPNQQPALNGGGGGSGLQKKKKRPQLDTSQMKIAPTGTDGGKTTAASTKKGMVGEGPSGLKFQSFSRGIDTNSYRVTQSGTFSKAGFRIGKSGVSASTRPEQLTMLDTELSRMTLDDLELGKFLGRGNASNVRVATHKPTGRQVALKCIGIHDAQRRQQLIPELDTLIRTRHPNLVSLYSCFFDGSGNIYIGLELMDEGSVDSIMKKLGKPPREAIVGILFQVLSGLAFLHGDLCKLHRDLKTENLLANSSGRIKIADLGLSKDVSATGCAKTFVGTASYMSPERLQGEEYSYASDVWSMGIVTLELAEGGHPFREVGNSDMDLLLAVIEGPTIPAELDAFLKDFLGISLRPEQKERAFVEDLLSHPFITTCCRDDAAACDAVMTWIHPSAPLDGLGRVLGSAFGAKNQN